MTNLLIAISNIVENPITDLVSHYRGSNRANSMGDALEVYVKDVFCGSLNKTNQEKDSLYSQNFSYLGNQNNPPDIIVKEGDAIEVKKIESLSSAIALNSSYPKNKLHHDDSRITNECRNCEEATWESKDIIYSVGVAPKGTNKLKALWFVYGSCYAANRNTYTRIADKITNGIQEINDVEFIETNELAKVKKVDPLGITDLRVRGMWHIANPVKVFEDHVTLNKEKEFSVNTIILEEKYNSFPKVDRDRIESISIEGFSITDIQIKSPNNPAKLLKAKLISYEK
ncbi:MAG: NgoPII family restriction endonuclease [Candidatus Delongbacteria bacterium]|nr:NgoPII family restriction endonuclease [Candidatus Delongbacteria bacterium]